ncbi:hypothetical protein TcCL_Unassigned02995 [Trypanosoma cruzi]|nr:hypothetical protein TcCL_Unassigned02995 [Trypanosoma cruzi]
MRPDFATNLNEMMVPNASKKRKPSIANGPRILVASNASGIMSVTCGGREHVAADNTDEVNERSATGHKSFVLENGVAGSGFVAEGDAYGLSQHNASGHDNRPQLQKCTAQCSGSGGSPHDCIALLKEAKLALRELIVDGTVRVCVLGVAASSGVVWSCGGLVSRRVWNCDSSWRTRAALHACFIIYILLLALLFSWNDKGLF